MSFTEDLEKARGFARDKRLSNGKPHAQSQTRSADEGVSVPASGAVTGPVSNRDQYIKHHLSGLVSTPGRTHDTDPDGGLHTGHLSDGPTPVGGYRHMDEDTATKYAQQFGDEFDKMSPRDQAAWRPGQAGLRSSASPGSPGTSAQSYFEANRPSLATKTGQSYDPAPPVGPLTPGTSEVVPNGNPNPLKQGVVTGGQNESGGDSGIKVNGQWVTHGADNAKGNAPLVASAPTKTPLSFADQQAQIVQTYPQVGVAGSDQNKAYVDAFNKGGQNQDGALDLAHSILAPKTQAGVIAQDQTQAGAAAAKVATDASANMTPGQKQIVQQRQDANQAAVAAAGKSVYDPDNTAKTFGQHVGDALEGGSLDSFTGFYKDHLVTPIADAAKSLWSGITGNTGATPAVPAAPPPAPAPPVAAPSPKVPSSPLSPAAPAAPSISAQDYFSQSAPSTNPAAANPAPSVGGTASPVPSSPNATGLTADEKAQNTTNAQAQGAAAATLANDPLLKSSGLEPAKDGRVAAAPTTPGNPEDDEEEGSAQAYFGKKSGSFATA